MKGRVVLVLALLALASPVAAQTSPCAMPPSTTINLGATKIWALLVDHAVPTLQRYELTIWPISALGGNPSDALIIQNDVYQKADFQPVAGFPGCYVATLKPYPKDRGLFATLSAIHSTPELGVSKFTSGPSDPFGDPTARTMPTRLVIR